jgi:hypothetical protein
LHPEQQWPPAATIRRWLGGGWNDCLKRAYLDPVPDGDLVVAAIGPRFSDEEMKKALRDCAHDLGKIPTRSVYVAWAKRPDVIRRPGRRPQSHMVFNRLGGFPDALAAAGLDDDRTLDELGLPRDVIGRKRLAAYRVTDEAIADAVREIAARCARVPRTTDYVRERELVHRESIEAGEPRHLPSYGSIIARYECWDAVLVAAGLLQADPLRRANGKKFEDDDIDNAVRRAGEAIGDAPDSSAYRSWHASLPEDERERTPTEATVRRRRDTWSKALAAVYGRDPRRDNGDEPLGETAETAETAAARVPEGSEQSVAASSRLAA